MERNRDARRSTTAAMNGAGAGGGLSRRRQRNGSSSFKDSPDDAGIESPETSRLRDRGLRKDRHRDGSSRRKRRRRERLLHGSNREEGEESSEESIDDDEEDEDDEEDMAVRHRPDNLTASSSSSQHQLQQNYHNHHYNQHHHHHHQLQQQHQQRKTVAPGVGRPPAVWTGDEMIGVAVPRKARSASLKRSHEYSGGGVAGGGTAAGGVEAGSGSGEQPARQASTSPSRMSPASASQISPASSNASIRKKTKPMSGSKHKPPKTTTKSPSSMIQDDLEIEVAEVLYGLTRQFQRPDKPENHKAVESRESNGASGNETKSRVSMPSLVSRPPASHPSVPPSNSIPKRKKPRPEKFDDESPISPAGVQNVTTTCLSSGAKLEPENATKMETSSPQTENIAAFAIETGVSSTEMPASLLQAARWDAHKEPAEPEKSQLPDSRPSEGGSGSGNMVGSEKDISASKVTPAILDASLSATSTSKNSGTDSPLEEKFKFDLMAPPPGKLSPDGEESNFVEEHKTVGPEIEMGLKGNSEKKDVKAEEKLVEKDEAKVEKLVQDFNLKKQVNEPSIELQLDSKKMSKDDVGGSNLQVQKQQLKATKIEMKNDKSASMTSMNVPMNVGTWPGGFPPFGYMGQIPSLPPVIPVDGAAGPTNALQPPAFFSTQPRPKRCATHGYIAQTIHHHQKLARMNPFWSAAAGITSLYGAKPYGLNIFPNSEAALFGSPMQGAYPGKITGSFHESKNTPMVAAAYSGHIPKDKVSPARNVTIEASQMKQSVLPHMSQPGMASNMMHGPTLIFPLNQQQASVAAAGAANQTGATKFTLGVSNAVPSTAAASSSATGGSTNSGSATPMNLSFANLSPSEAQYLAFLQNNAYPFPLAHVAGAPQFRGINPAQALPSFYPSHMVHSSQLHFQQQQQQPGPPHPSLAQHSHQKPSASNESSSYHKHPQQSQNIAGGAGPSSHGLPVTHQRSHPQPQSRQQESNRITEDNPPTPESKASQVHKGLSGQNFSLPIHHQNFALMATAAATTAQGVGNGGGHGLKQQMYQLPHQKQNTKIEMSSPQAFTMPFASFNGTPSAAPGLDFSSMVQNHVIFQSHSETSRQGYHQIATSASTQQNKLQSVSADQGKSGVRESINGKVTNADERKIMSGGKPTASTLQNSLIFTKTDGESLISSTPSNNVLDCTSQTFNLIQAPANGSKVVNHPPGSVVTNSNSADVTSVSMSTSQQQSIQLSKHQHQQQQQQQQQQLTSSRPKTSTSSNIVSVYSDRFPGGQALAKFPQSLTGYPQPPTQGGTSHPSAQTKACNRRVAPTSAYPATTPGRSNHIFQHQGRSTQQPMSNQGHQMQSPFSMNSLKMVGAGGQHLPGGSTNPTSVAAMAFSSPSNPVSKNAGGSQATPMSKPGSAKSSVPVAQQSSPKHSSVSSGSRSSPANNMPSVLGHPQNSSASNSSNKVQQQQQQQQSQQSQKQQPFHQAQVFFSNPYMQQHHSLQSNIAAAAAAAGYYQKRQSEQYTQQQSQQQHQLGSMSGSTGMLAISSVLSPSCASSTSDPAKASAAGTLNSMKVPSVLQATQLAAVAQSASGSPRPLIPASFPFVPMPAETGKATSEQNSAAGGDNLHSCWQPEKK